MLRMLSAPEPRQSPARAARCHAQHFDLVQDAYDIAWLELSYLQVGARSQVRPPRPPRSPVLGHISEPRHLRRCSYAARCAKTQHKGVLRGSDVKEPVKLEAKQIVRGRRTILSRMSNNLLPDVETVLFVFPHLFAAKLTDGYAEE